MLTVGIWRVNRGWECSLSLSLGLGTTGHLWPVPETDSLSTSLVPARMCPCSLQNSTQVGSEQKQSPNPTLENTKYNHKTSLLRILSCKGQKEVSGGREIFHFYTHRTRSCRLKKSEVGWGWGAGTAAPRVIKRQSGILHPTSGCQVQLSVTLLPIQLPINVCPGRQKRRAQALGSLSPIWGA